MKESPYTPVVGDSTPSVGVSEEDILMLDKIPTEKFFSETFPKFKINVEISCPDDIEALVKWLLLSKQILYNQD